jgi:small subunit ribosomal protein S21
MTTIYAKPGESIDSMLRRFKKAVDKSGVLADLKKHEYYDKPGVKRKKKQAAAKKRSQKLARKFSGNAERKVSNQNFKWNRDHTKKIPMPPLQNNRPPPNRGNPNNRQGTNQSNQNTQPRRAQVNNNRR